MSEDKKHMYVLFVDLTFACFFASYSYTANDRKLDSDTRLYATSSYRVAFASVFLFLSILLIYIITGFTVPINDAIFTKSV